MRENPQNLPEFIEGQELFSTENFSVFAYLRPEAELVRADYYEDFAEDGAVSAETAAWIDSVIKKFRIVGKDSLAQQVVRLLAEEMNQAIGDDMFSRADGDSWPGKDNGQLYLPYSIKAWENLTTDLTPDLGAQVGEPLASALLLFSKEPRKEPSLYEMELIRLKLEKSPIDQGIKWVLEEIRRRFRGIGGMQ